MTDHDLDLSRAEAAARRYLADEAAAVGFRPLDPDALKPARRSRRRAGWLATAACVAAVLVAVPLALRPGGTIAATPEPEPGLAWTKTAQSPLEPRFGAFTAWLGEEFLVVGGWTGGPCPPGAMCDLAPPDTRDGARYDPRSDTWRTIAALPTGFGRGYGTGAAGLGAFYAVSYAEAEAALWRYDPAADVWQQLAEPPAWGELVGSPEALLLVTGDESPAGFRYDPQADAWTALPAGPLDACTTRQGLADAGSLVVVAECGTPGATEFADDPQLATLDLRSGAWTPAVALDSAVRGRAVLAGGRLVWPDLLSVVSSVSSPGIYDLAAGRWFEVAVDRPSGPLAYRGMVGSTGYLALDGLGLAAADGHLLDTATGRWVEVPDPGVPSRWDPIRVAAPAALLDCFGYEYTDDEQREGRYVPGCRLLSAPTGPEPSVAPTSDSTQAGEPPASGLVWEEVLPAADPVPTDPLLVAADGSYFLMGGYVLDNEIDDVQLHSGRRFDPATGQWRPIADLPQVPVSRPYTLNADVVGTLIYVHLSFEETGELWAYDTVADAWNRIGPTDETDHYLGTEDGLVRFRQLGEGPDGPAPQLLTESGWTDLPGPPLVPDPAADVFRLDDHAIGLETDGRVVVLDTAGRTWGQPSEAGSTANRRALGAGGAVAFVYPPDDEGEFLPNHKYGLDIVTYRDGSWGHPSVLDQDGGLGSYIGAGPGRWLVVTGNLFDPATGDWLRLPALPWSEYGWESRIVAATNDSVMTCFPYSVDRDRTLTEDGCYLLRLP